MYADEAPLLCIVIRMNIEMGQEYTKLSVVSPQPSTLISSYLYCKFVSVLLCSHCCMFGTALQSFFSSHRLLAGPFGFANEGFAGPSCRAPLLLITTPAGASWLRPALRKFSSSSVGSDVSILFVASGNIDPVSAKKSFAAR